MSAISELAAVQDAAFAQMGIALDGIKADIAALKPTPEDVATVERLKATAQAMADSLASLDAENP